MERSIFADVSEVMVCWDIVWPSVFMSWSFPEKDLLKLMFKIEYAFNARPFGSFNF